jgi:hypothetical protein
MGRYLLLSGRRRPAADASETHVGPGIELSSPFQASRRAIILAPTRFVGDFVTLKAAPRSVLR